MEYTRTLRQGMAGSDVKYIKELLLSLGYYTGVTTISNSIFGNDTVKAVKKYQESNKDTTGVALVVDSIIGKKTWGSIVKSYESLDSQPTESILSQKDYPNISKEALDAISKDLVKVSSARKKIVKEILHYAYDRKKGGDITALYIWGANLYTTGLKLNLATTAMVNTGASRNPSYFNNGRKQMMLNAVKKNPNLPASDCSGMEVGYLRENKYVKSSFDATANSLCSDTYSKAVTRDELIPADWVGYTGHIGTYVGGNFVIEFAGGAYGCQLTELTDRILYSFVTKKTKKGTTWKKFRNPKFY